MSSKINVWHIVEDHLATLVVYGTQKASKIDYVVFYVLPFVCTAGLTWQGFRLDTSESTILITALSIFAALLFNLLLLTHSIVSSTGFDEHPRRHELLEQIYAHISYAILVAVVAVAFLLLDVVWPNCIVNTIASFVVYFFVMNFLATLLLILKRIHEMLSREFE